MTAPKLDAAFDMVDTLATGSQNIVDMLCERISPKGGAPAEKSRRMAADTSVLLAQL
jgi:DNA-binding ferritin-like protein